MPPVTRLAKKRETMEPYHLDHTSSLPLSTPPSYSPEKSIPSSTDLEAFMNQPGNAMLVNAIIDKNKETIMENFQRDNVGAFDFGRPPALSDLSHPLFGQVPPPIGSYDPNHPSYIPHEEPPPTPYDPTDPNIPSSTQVEISIPQTNPVTTPPPLVHATPSQTPFAQKPHHSLPSLFLLLLSNPTFQIQPSPK